MTNAALIRVAKERGLYVGGHLEVGRLIDQLVEEAGLIKSAPVPEYLRLAQEAGLPVRA